MKKGVSVTLFLFFVLFFPTLCLADTNINVKVDETNVVFTQATPINQNGRTMVPVRALFEAMGAAVSWDGARQEVTAELTKDGTTTVLHLFMNSPYVQKDIKSAGGSVRSSVIRLDVPPVMIGVSTFIPLRISGESFGYDVKWNEESKQAALGYKGFFQIPSSFEEYPLIGDIAQMNNDEMQAYFLTNDIRNEKGVTPLGLHVPLSLVARERSTDMAVRNYYDHKSPDGRMPSDWIKSAGIASSGGENIAAGEDLPKAVIRMWKNSAGHLRNMTNKSYTYIGIGHHFLRSAPKGHYWTQLFVSKLNETSDVRVKQVEYVQKWADANKLQMESDGLQSSKVRDDKREVLRITYSSRFLEVNNESDQALSFVAGYMEAFYIRSAAQFPQIIKEVPPNSGLVEKTIDGMKFQIEKMGHWIWIYL